jgi:hypothetical protein
MDGMDSSVAAAFIGASAAILGSVGAGCTTYLATRRTLANSSSELTTRLKDERDAAREEREQERLKEAYVTLLRYVFWLSDVNSIERGIVTRQHSAITNLRADRGAPKTSQDAASEINAFVSAGPTEHEQQRLDAGPTHKDNAATWALVKALSSDAVLTAFEELMKRDHKFSSSRRDVEVALLRKPSSATVEGVVADTDPEQIRQATKQKLEATKRLLVSTSNMIDAGKEVESAVETLTDLVRTELTQARST